MDTVTARRPAHPTTTASADGSIARAGLTAGIGLLLMAPLAIVAFLVIIDGSVTPGDAAATVADITASEGRFRAGVVALMLVVVLDVVVAWALYRVFRPVDAGLSLLAAWLRLVYSGIFLVAIARLVGVARLVGSDDHLAALGQEGLETEVLLSIDAFGDIWSAGLLLFGGHLLLLGRLAYRSRYVPRALGVLVALAGLGYVVDSVAQVLAPGRGIEVAAFTAAGEVLLALWLVVRWRRLAAVESAGAPGGSTWRPRARQ